jgi:deoxyhypusine synthase
VPVFVPAFTDSILGMQAFFYSQTHPLEIDVLSDLGRIIDISHGADVSGALIIGGGVPKNFILQSKLVAPKGFSFSVQITTDRPEPGGLSGATLDEAISWGKVEGDSESVTVYGDATILLPLIVAAVREDLGDALPREARRG